MAPFNPEIQEVQGPNYFTYSKGTGGLEVDQSKAAFAKGIGDIATGAVNAVDTGIQLQIKKDVYDFSDKLRDQWGNTAAVNLEKSYPFDINSPTQALGGRSGAGAAPAELAGLGPKLDRLQQAKAAGKLENSDYWAQAESLVRQMRSRYPGYRDVIDRDVAQVLGNTPANALHEAMMHELDKSASQSQKQRAEYIAFLNANEAYLPADARARLDAGNPYPISQLYAKVAATKGYEHQRESAKADLAYRKALGEDVAERGRRAYVQDANNTVQTVIAKMGPAAGFSGYNDVVEFVNNRNKTGGGFNSEELGRLQNYFTLLETNIRAALSAGASANISKEPGQFLSFNQIVPSAKLKEHDEQAMSAFLAYKNAVLTQNFTMAGYFQGIAQNAENAGVAAALSDPVMQQAHTALKVLGPEGMPLWMRQPGIGGPGSTNLGDLNQALHNMDLLKSGFGGFKSTGDVVVKAQQRDIANGGNGKDPAIFNAIINDRVRTIADKDTNPDMRVNYINEMFGAGNKDFLKKFADTPQASRADIYTKMTAPQVTDSVFELAKTNPSVWNNYRNWAAQTFVSQFHADGTTLQNAIVNDPFSAVSWDPGAKQFNYAATRPGYVNADAKSAVDKLNRQIRTMDYILTKDGRDSGAEFQKLFAAMGINTGAEKSDSAKAQQGVKEPPLTPPGATKPVTGPTGEQGAGPSGDMGDLSSIPGLQAAKRALDAFTARNRALYGGTPSQFAAEPSTGLSGASKGIADAIKGAESKSSGEYDAVMGEKKGFAKPSAMTINEVLDFQKQRIAEGKNTAVGAYQITNATLKGLVKQMGLTGDEKFDQATQDALFEQLLQKRGAADFLNDRIDENTFAKNLSQEWAGLPSDSRGKSFYDGVGNNKARTDFNTVLGAIRAYKQQAM
jgi:muramidase (phage lysozyme)